MILLTLKQTTLRFFLQYPTHFDLSPLFCNQIVIINLPYQEISMKNGDKNPISLQQQNHPDSNFYLLIINSNMQFDSIASGRDHFFVESVKTNKFLINTSKVIKGHKLKTKDFVQMQLLRFRKCSPIKYQNLYPYDNSTPENASKGFQFKKFRPFQSVNHEDMHKIVENQRIKLSRQTKGRIKMFNNTKINCMFQNTDEKDKHFPLGSKSKTGQNYRKLKKNEGHNKTATNQSLINNQQGKKEKRKAATFKSQNLGNKMNGYLNLYLNRQKQQQQPEEKKEEKEDPITIPFEEKQSHTIDVFRKKPNLAYIRKMKKHVKSRVDSTDAEIFNQNRSEQLTKSNTAVPSAKRQHLLVYNKQN